MSENDPGGRGAEPPRPGIVPLRALDAGEIVGGGIRFVRANPVAVLVPSLVLSLLVLGAQAAATGFDLDRPVTTDPGTAFAEGSLAAIPAALVTLAVAPPAIATVLATLHPAVLGRSRIGLGHAWAAARPRLGAIYGVEVVVTVVGLLPTLVTSGVAGPLWGAGGIGAVLGGVLVAVSYLLMLYLSVLLALAPAAAVVEGRPARDALWRSVELVRGSWWRCFGVQILVGLSVVLAVFVVAIPVGTVAVLIGVAGAVTLAFVLGGVAIVAVVTATYGFGIGATALLHQDQRVRRERHDLDLQHEAGGAA
ncbi:MULTISPECIES: hypothetical protein [unclassified Pseudonocardia]|uniref:hypothetical protein n=1 Tax=unclassified Pseudonocardia TaxID=2619320 RepID=UPI00094B6A13|nr:MULTISPECIES: hypothetical protein [unclassified Pseudonocardia]